VYKSGPLRMYAERRGLNIIILEYLVSSTNEASETIVRLQKDSDLYNKISNEAFRTARENSNQTLAKQVDTLYNPC